MVRQVELPRAARALSTLSRIDYEDAFLGESDYARERTAEQWARAILEDAPIATQAQLRWGWFWLGLRLGWPCAAGHVLGWEVRRSTPDFVLLGAGSRIGMPAELVCRRQGDTVLVATLVQQQNPVARAIWVGVEPVHVRIVPRLVARALRQGARRAA